MSLIERLFTGKLDNRPTDSPSKGDFRMAVFRYQGSGQAPPPWGITNEYMAEGWNRCVSEQSAR